uniref:Uncharacterized protein n=1 Tax=Anopheles farauti TaxID=69004 RepID=A0A182QIP4_9DIPT
MDLLRTFASESSIHGLAHLVRSPHWLGKAFWMVILVFSVVCSVSICNMHWERFQKNATVLNVETNYLSWVFRPPAATVCSQHVSEEILNQLLQRYWNVERNHSDYDYYRRFLLTVNHARFDNLNTFEPFANDTKLASISLLDLARELKYPLVPPWKTFAPVLTEVGYIHTEQDVMTTESSIHYVLRDHDIISSSLSVEQVVASKALKQLSRRRRKCRLPKERLAYFDLYTINLCRINCRIEAALELCKCVPFFYNIGKTSCPPAGLHCLSRNHAGWYESKNCTCQPLCESISFKQVLVKRKVLEQANSKLETQIIYPRMRMKRDVLFDISNLIVSLGGAAGLFLGCSFISFVEIMFFMLEFVTKKIYRWYQRHRELNQDRS